MKDAFVIYDSKEDLVTRDYAPGEKEALLKYMGSFPLKAVAAGYFEDVVTGDEEAGVDYIAYDDGEFQWTSQDTYHVEHYDLSPCSEFLATALAA